jgi:hypothetical protein
MVTLISGKCGTSLVEVAQLQTLLNTGPNAAAAHRPGVRVMLVTDQPEGATASRLIGYGSFLDIEDAVEVGVAAILEDPMGYDLFVLDCDAFGGIDAAEVAIAALIEGDARMRVLLVSREFDEPAYPLGRRSAVCLPVITDEDEFRRGFDHVLRDRASVTLM